MRANASVASVQAGHRFSHLPGRRASSTALKPAALEVELKLDATAEHLDILKKHPLFHNSRSSISIYLDTKDRVFRRHGLSFRLGRKGEKVLQTIKGPYRGVLDRSERETPFIGDGDDHPRAVEAFMRQLDGNVPTSLKPIFKTRIECETCRIGGIEVCLDNGEIIAGRRSSPIAEIKLELKSGDRSGVFALARQISAIVPAEISLKSKSDRGYEFVDGIKDRWVRARDPGLSRFSTPAETFKIICGECLHQLIANQAGARARIAEALHQARVALRRLDAALRLFRNVQPEKATKVASELKWIGDELASARELDVFMTDFLVPLRGKQPTDLRLTSAYRACVQLREKAYKKANAALSSQRFRMFLIDVAEWIEPGNEERKARSRAKDEPSAKDIVSKTLSKTWRKMMSIKRVDKLDVRRLHRLRLRAKRMRYTIEFTRGLYEINHDRVEGMLERLGKLQAVLGKLADMASARTILGRIAVEAEADPRRVRRISSSVATIAGDQERQKSKQLKKAVKAFEKLEHLRPFWT